MAVDKFYTDSSFKARVETVVVATVAGGTATASGSNNIANVFTLPPFIRNKKLSWIRVRTTTSSANLTGGQFVFVFIGPSIKTQGVSGPTGTGAALETNTVTVTASNTTGSYADGQILSTVGTTTFNVEVPISSNTSPTVAFVGTSTASGQNLGTYAISFETSEEFSQ